MRNYNGSVVYGSSTNRAPAWSCALVLGLVLALWMGAGISDVAAQVDPGGGGGSGGGGSTCDSEIFDISLVGDSHAKVEYRLDDDYPLTANFEPFYTLTHAGYEIDRASLSLPDQCVDGEFECDLDSTEGSFVVTIYYDEGYEGPGSYRAIARGFTLSDGQITLAPHGGPTTDISVDSGVYQNSYAPTCGQCKNQVGAGFCPNIPEINLPVQLTRASPDALDCGGCGGIGQTHNLIQPSFQLTPLRAPFPSNVSPAFSTNFDKWGHVFGKDNQYAVFRVVGIPAQDSMLTFTDGLDEPQDGVMFDEHGLARHAKLMGAGGAVTSDYKNADHVLVTAHDGSSYRFNFYMDDDGDGAGLDADARLVSETNRMGVETISIAYQDEAAGSTALPARKIDTVSDRFGNQMTFNYGADVGGREAISSISFSNGAQVTFHYSGHNLVRAELPDVWRWKNSVASNGDNVVFSIEDPARGKYQYEMTADYKQIGNGQGVHQVLAQPSGFFKKLTNGDGENVVSVFYKPGDNRKQFILRGSDQLCHLDVEVPSHSLAFYKTFTPGTDYLSFSGVIEPTHQTNGYFSAVDYERSWLKSAPTEYTDETGVQVIQVYDDEHYLTKRTYSSDGSFEAWQRDANKRVTRYRDREGRVTKYAYDALGNKEYEYVGILDVNGTDIPQPEYAVYRWEHGSTVAPDLVTREYSPRNSGSTGSGGQADLYLTEYEYYPNGMLKKVIESADVAGGDRPTTQYEYNGFGQITKMTDPLLRETLYDYDDLYRRIQTTYPDGSTEQIQYGSSWKTGLVILSKDRVNVVTRHIYDLSGRRKQTISGHAVDSDILDQNPVSGVVTDPNQKRHTYRWFLAGSQIPYKTKVNSKRSDFSYDYRRRVKEQIVYPHATRNLKSSVDYLNNRVFKETDAYGRSKYYSYDSDGDLKRTVQATHQDVLLSNFADVNALTRSTTHNASHLIVDYQYDNSGNLTQVTDANGNVSQSVYDSRNQETAQLAAVGTAQEARTKTIFDTAGNVVEIQTPRFFDASDPEQGNVRSTFTYDGRDQPDSETSAPGTSVAATSGFTYYLDGRVQQQTDARNHGWMSYWHACCGRLLAKQDPLGNAVIENTDFLGRVTHRVTVKDYTSSMNAHDPPATKTVQEVTTRYDAMGRVVATTAWVDPLGNVDPNNVPIAGLDGVAYGNHLTTRYFYDVNLADASGINSAAGLNVAILEGGTYQLSIADCLTQLEQTFANGGAAIEFVAEKVGSAMVKISPEGEVAVTISDSLGRSVFTGAIQPHDGTNPNQLVSWVCTRHDRKVNVKFGDGANHKTHETVTIDAKGKTTKIREDGGGRVLKTVDQAGKSTDYDFDHNSNLAKLRDPNLVGFDVLYDALDRRTRVTDTQGDQVEFTYDLENNILTEKDGKGKQSEAVYDARNRRKQETDRLNGTTYFTYDNNGNITLVTDAESEATAYDYDERNLLVKETYPDTSVVEYQYDAADRMIRKTDKQGDTIALTYDPVDRLLQTDYRLAANSPHGAIEDSDVFAYDKAMRVTSAQSTRYNNTVHLTYDEIGRPASESLTISGQTYVVARHYDQRSQLDSVTYPDGSVVTRNYTARGNLLDVSYDRPDSAASFQIDSRSYDIGGRLKDRTCGNGLKTSLTYRDDGQVATIELTNPNTNVTLDSFSYGYDPNKNVLSELRTQAMASHSWSTSDGSGDGFDDQDRLVHWKRDNGSQVQSWQLSLVGDWDSVNRNGTPEVRNHDPSHKLSTINGSTTLNYDAKGNLTQNATGHTYHWDADNQLEFVDTSGNGSSNRRFKYDAFGRRVWVQNNVYVPMGKQMVARYAKGDNPASPKNKWIFGDYLDEPILIDRYRANNPEQPWAEMYYHRDRRYNVTALSWADASVRERYSYDPYGETTILEGDGVTVRTHSIYQNNFMYTGRFYEPTLDLYYFRNRWYDSTLGRFINQDPLGYVDGMSLYGAYFAPNNLDPVGLKWVWPWDPNASWDVRDTATLWSKPAKTFVDGGVDGIRDFGYGVKRTGKGLYHGTLGFFDVRHSLIAARMNQQHRDMRELAAWLASDPDPRVKAILDRVLKFALKQIPACVKEKFLKDLATHFGVKIAGRMFTNYQMNKLFRKVIQSIANKATKKAVAKGAKPKGGMAVGAAIFAYQLMGSVEQTAAAEQRLRRKHPRLWKILHRFHKTSYLYGFVEKEVDAILRKVQKFKLMAANDPCCK